MLVLEILLHFVTRMTGGVPINSNFWQPFRSRLIAIAEPLIRYRVHDAQQAGVIGRSVAAKLRWSTKTGIQQYRAIERQFDVLLNYAYTHPECCGSDLCERIREKRFHMGFRAALYETRLSTLRRFLKILARSREYHLYSEGLLSMLKDFLESAGENKSSVAEI